MYLISICKIESNKINPITDKTMVKKFKCKKSQKKCGYYLFKKK